MIRITMRGVRNTVAEIERELSRVVEKIAMDTEQVAVQNTPIDQGRARRGWILSKAGKNWRLFNRVPYIVHLENGHSKQAPNGITGPTVREISSRRYR
jgi:hypothetical protein